MSTGCQCGGFAPAAFAKLRNDLLLTACQAHADPIRHAVDEAVVEVLGVPEAALPFTANLRLLWGREPSVHDHNRRAVAPLNVKRGIKGGA